MVSAAPRVNAIRILRLRISTPSIGDTGASLLRDGGDFGSRHDPVTVGDHPVKKATKTTGPMTIAAMTMVQTIALRVAAASSSGVICLGTRPRLAARPSR